MKALVTGATGFVGSHLLDHLVENGWETRCLVRSGSAFAAGAAEGFERVRGDIRDKSSLRRATEGVACVFHLAAAQHVQTGAEVFEEINVGGTQNLLEACAQAKGGKARFVYISSISAVGPRLSPEVLNESSLCVPLDPYGKSKLRAERMVLAYRERIPVTIVRPSLVYGPRDKNQLTVVGRMKTVKKGFYFTKKSANSRFSCIHAKDLARGILSSARQPNGVGSVFFLCNPEPTTYEEICSLTASALGKRALRVVVPTFLLGARRATQALISPDRRPVLTAIADAVKQPTRHWICTGAKAAKVLGFRPEISLSDGIAETARWYLHKGWI